MAPYQRPLFNPECGALTSPPSEELIKRAEQHKVSRERVPKLGGYAWRKALRTESRPARLALLSLALAGVVLKTPTTYLVGRTQLSIREARLDSQLLKEYPHVSRHYDPITDTLPKYPAPKGNTNLYEAAILQYRADNPHEYGMNDLPPGSNMPALEAPSTGSQPSTGEAGSVLETRGMAFEGLS